MLEAQVPKIVEHGSCHRNYEPTAEEAKQERIASKCSRIPVTFLQLGLLLAGYSMSRISSQFSRWKFWPPQTVSK